MKTSASVLLLNFLVAVSLSNAASDSHSPILRRQRRQSLEKPLIKNEILELVQNLQVTSKEVVVGFKSITDRIHNLISDGHAKLTSKVAKLRERLSAINQTLTTKMKFARTAAIECIKTNSEEADSILGSAVENTIGCAEDRIAKISKLIAGLTGKALFAVDTADDALKKVKNCTNSEKIFKTGACIGLLALKTELKTRTVLPESGILLARIYVAVATLPTALEVCAAKNLSSAVFATGGFAVAMKKCAGFFVQ